MTYRYHGPDPAELAFWLALVGLGLGAYTLFWVARVLAARRRQRHAEWAMRERLARWRVGAEHAAGPAARPGGPPGPP